MSPVRYVGLDTQKHQITIAAANDLQKGVLTLQNISV